MNRQPNSGLELSNEQLAAYIDHTLLKPEATAEAVDRLCAEALENGFCAVCVNGCWTARCAKLIEESRVRLAVVVGFPLGAAASGAKAAEARQAVENGAHELDMVMNIGALKSADFAFVRDDVRAVREASNSAASRRGDSGSGAAPLLKVIIETALLTDAEKRRACRLAVDGGADFVKTSTGFAKGGATVEDVELMRSVVGAEIGVKAAGGIRTRADAIAMIRAGATRLGTSAGVAIITDRGGSGPAGY